MSHKITLEEEKKIAIGYPYFTQRQIKEKTGHGWTQVNRTLKAKNIAWLLFHEVQLHDLTKYANTHLQEKLKDYKIAYFILNIVIFVLGISIWFL